MTHLTKAQFAQAAEGFDGVLTALPAHERGTVVEQDVRAMLALSLYDDQRKDAAVAAYQQLMTRFPEFAFDQDVVLPETIEFFRQQRASPQTQALVASSTSNSTAPGSWRWYYLTPLGVGQFLAGSPIRGGIFAGTQVGLLALNIVAAVAFQNERRADGFVQSKARADTAQTVMNIAFFSLLGAVAAGAVDAIWFEP